MNFKISQREKILIAIVLIIAFCFIFYTFIYKKQVLEIVTLNTQISANNKVLSELKGFDAKVQAVEKEVDKLDQEIYTATRDWFPSIKQNIIIKDLESKIKNTNLTETNITFKSSQVEKIADITQEIESTTIDKALALAFVTMMQEENVAAVNSSNPLGISSTPAPSAEPEKSDDKKADKTKASSAKAKNSNFPLEVQSKLDTLNKTLSSLTDAELKSQVTKLLADTQANVHKLTLTISFKNTSYESIMDFIYKVEQTSPNIYIENINYVDSTREYITILQSELEQKHSLESNSDKTDTLFSNTPTFENNLAIVRTLNYVGSDKYSGEMTLSYFAVSKIHNQ